MVAEKDDINVFAGIVEEESLEETEEEEAADIETGNK